MHRSCLFTNEMFSHGAIEMVPLLICVQNGAVLTYRVVWLSAIPVGVMQELITSKPLPSALFNGIRCCNPYLMPIGKLMQERILLRGPDVHQATAQSMARFEGVHPGFFPSYQVVAVVTKFLPVRFACDRIFETFTTAYIVVTNRQPTFAAIPTVIGRVTRIFINTRASCMNTSWLLRG